MARTYKQDFLSQCVGLLIVFVFLLGGVLFLTVGDIGAESQVPKKIRTFDGYHTIKAAPGIHHKNR